MNGEGGADAYLSGLAYSLGQPMVVDSLAEQGLSAQEIKDLRDRGFSHFLKDHRPSWAMCIDSAAATIAAADVPVDRIDAIILANCGRNWEQFDELAFLKALRGIGIGDVPLYGLALQACSASSAALRLGSSLVRHDGMRDILVILFGSVDEEKSRSTANSLFSDGAASCLISSRCGDFEIVRSELCSTPSLTEHELFSLHFSLGSYSKLRDRISAACPSHPPSALSKIFPTNTNLATAMLVAEAAEVEAEQLHVEGMARYGHVFGCDPLIGLKDHTDRERPPAGTQFALVGWSPYVFGVTILSTSGSGALAQERSAAEEISA